MADAYSTVVAFMIRKSLAGQASADPKEVRNDPDYEIDHHDILGRIPVQREGAATKALGRAVRTLLWAVRPVSGIDRTHWKSLDEAKAQARSLYAPHLPEVALETDPQRLSDRELFLMLTCRGFAHLRPSGDAYLFEVQDPPGIRYKAGFVELSCKVLLDQERLLSIETAGERLVPGDPGWELAKMVVRSAQFVHITVVEHSAWLHGLLSARFFLGVHEVLPPDHPLRRLLLPYVHNQHKNLARARYSVFSELGGALAILPFEFSDSARWLQDAMKRFQPTLPSEVPVRWTQGLVIAQRIWDTMRDHVGRYLEHYGLSARDEATARWLEYLVKNAHPRFGTLPLADTVTYVMFAPSVLHHLWGHIYNGSVDPAYVSSGMQSPHRDGEPLLSRGESKAHSAIRVGVITSIARPVPRLTGDFSHLALDPEGAAILESLSRGMKDGSAWLDAYCSERGLPNLASPSQIATSMST